MNQSISMLHAYMAIGANTAWKGVVNYIGHIDAVSMLYPYAEACEAALGIWEPDYPGVFEYEVAEPFGRWFGEYISACDDEPTQDIALETLANLVANFFTRGETP